MAVAGCSWTLSASVSGLMLDVAGCSWYTLPPPPSPCAPWPPHTHNPSCPPHPTPPHTHPPTCSRLSSSKLAFHPYSSDQLYQIVKQRLTGPDAGEGAFTDVAIKTAAGRVGGNLRTHTVTHTHACTTCTHTLMQHTHAHSHAHTYTHSPRTRAHIHTHRACIAYRHAGQCPLGPWL